MNERSGRFLQFFAFFCFFEFFRFLTLFFAFFAPFSPSPHYQADPSQQAYGQYQTTPQYAMVQSVSPYGYSPYAIATPTSPTNESMCASQAGEYFQWTQHPQTSLMTDSSMMNLSQNEQSILSQSPSKASGSQEQ